MKIEKKIHESKQRINKNLKKKLKKKKQFKCELVQSEIQE